MEKENNIQNQTNPDFIHESKEDIIAGARVFSDKASDIFNSFLERIRGTAEAAYEKGSEIVESVTLTAQNYIERYKDRSDISSLTRARDEMATKLGHMCYMEYSGRYRIRVEFQKSKEFKELMKHMKELDRQIIEIGKRLEEDH
jgi:hypothetical protein